MIRPALTALLCALCATPALALDLALPSGAQQTAEADRPSGSFDLATGPWTPQDGVPVETLRGAIDLGAWRVSGTSASALQLMEGLADQITGTEGWEIVYRCGARACGGFDFRFGIEVLPAPEMYVDLTAYRYLSARGPDGTALAVLTSRSDAAGYIQIARVMPGATEPPAPGPDADTPTTDPAIGVEVAPATAANDTPVRGEVAERLEAEGRVVLTDMRFETGSSALEGEVASLDALAVYLAEAADRRIVFVGHTDATGSLDANRALSRRRAQAAVDYIRDAGVSASQVSAEGVGYLAPVASNLTEAGRTRNRRVEAVLLP